MDAVARMGRIIKETAHLTRDQDGLGCAKLVVFCNAVEDNPFMAGAFHGVGEADSVINVGVSGPGVVYHALAEPARGSPLTWWRRPSRRRRSRSPAWVSWWPRRRPGGWIRPSASWICRWRPPLRWATAWPAFWRRWAWSVCGTHGTTAALALLNDAVKKGGVMASSHVGGLSGAFIPVSRGRGHDRRRSDGTLTWTSWRP